ncbi:MAG: aldose epimerase family protein [Deltaproteobacteria bacterium]
MNLHITLESKELSVVLAIDKGADICSIREKRRDVDLLFSTPWPADNGPAPSLGLGSKAEWLQRYAGGWQILCPNAGEERSVHGGTWGYHGEAALVPWRLEAATGNSGTLSVELFTAPLHLERHLELQGTTLHVTDGIVNLSPDPIEFSCVQQPAFGAPLIGPDCRVFCGARTLITDAEIPGSLLGPDQVTSWPMAFDRLQRPVDLRELPGEADPRSVFACLTDFDVPFFAFQNETLNLGVAMRWDAVVYPHAWFWQELHASSGFPWYRRAYVAAIEPANLLPGAGHVGGLSRGPVATLAPHSGLQVELVLSVFSRPGVVVSVDPDGTVITDAS